MTPSINWLTEHSPITFTDPPSPTYGLLSLAQFTLSSFLLVFIFFYDSFVINVQSHFFGFHEREICWFRDNPHHPPWPRWPGPNRLKWFNFMKLIWLTQGKICNKIGSKSLTLSTACNNSLWHKQWVQWWWSRWCWWGGGGGRCKGKPPARPGHPPQSSPGFS